MVVALGRETGREKRGQVITGGRLAIECLRIQSVQRELQDGVLGRREHGSAVWAAEMAASSEALRVVMSTVVSGQLRVES
jgi:hypothetical protein